MRQLFGIWVLVVIGLLQACGGSSNRDQLTAATPVTPTTSVSLFTSAPSSITFLAGGTAGNYAVGGGTPPYAASSSNAAVATVSLSGTSLSVKPNTVGTATVLLLDSVGAKIEFTVTVGSGAQVPALRTTAASAITLDAGGFTSFVISGGVAPYLSSSSNTASVVTGVSGNTLAITARQTAGTAQVLVIDATGTQVAIAVTVGSATSQALFTTAPSSITMASGAGPSSFTVGGGAPPYAASSSNAGVATVSVTGSTLSISPGASGSAGIVVLDSLGAKIELAIVVTSTVQTTALRTTAASAISMANNGVGSYLISGGTPPYLTSSSNSSVVTSAITGGNTLAITAGASAGTAEVLVIDTAGTQVSITVTVGTSGTLALFTSAPTNVTMSSGAAPATFSVGGGTPPYAASSSNTGVARASLSGTALTISSVSVGSATVSVVDALGSKVEIAVTVGSSTAPTALRTDAPSTLTLAAGNVRTYAVAGGQAPYAANSADENVTTARITGSTLTITGVATGATQILVLDAVGNQVLIGVTTTGTTASALFLATPSTVTVSVGAAAASFAIGGGTPPYTARSNSAAVASASVIGSSLSITGVGLGNATVTVFDAAGAQASVPVTVVSSTGVALTVSPSGASGSVGDVLNFVLLGGTPGYTMTSNNTNIATLSATSLGASGASFSATLKNVGDAIVTVRDAQNQTTSFVVSVVATSPQLRLSPSTFLVGENELGQIALNIYGGTPPYVALSSDLVKASVSVVGSVLNTLPGSSGNRCINPVTDDTPPVYIPSGTYAVTLTVIDSLGASATSVMTIKDNGAGLSAGCP